MSPHQERKPENRRKPQWNLQPPPKKSGPTELANPPKPKNYVTGATTAFTKALSNVTVAQAAALDRERRVNEMYPNTQRILFQAEIAEKKRQADVEQSGEVGTEEGQ